MERLKGKVCVITGCSSGIGRQIAIRFSAEGANLAICARRSELLEETALLCRKNGAEVIAKAFDLSDELETRNFIDRVAEKYGRIDVLVNNACSRVHGKPFLDQTVDDLMLPIRTGLIPTWRMMQLCFPLMKEQGGSIINTGSSSEDGGIGYAGYGAAKAAISCLSRSVALEFGEYNIRVNNIFPVTMTDTMYGQVSSDFSDERRAIITENLKKNALHRVGDAYKDVTPVHVFLASDESGWITGQNICAEGGQIIHR